MKNFKHLKSKRNSIKGTFIYVLPNSIMNLWLNLFHLNTDLLLLPSNCTIATAINFYCPIFPGFFRYFLAGSGHSVFALFLRMKIRKERPSDNAHDFNQSLDFFLSSFLCFQGGELLIRRSIHSWN